MLDTDLRRKYLNVKERKRYYEVVRKISDPVQRAFLLLLYHTGCRISEGLNLTPTGIDYEEKRLTFVTLKQRGKFKTRTVPMPDELGDLLCLLTAEHDIPKNDRIFTFSRTTGWRRIKDCMALAGLKGIKATPKGLRHAYAIVCILKKIPLTQVQKWLGHSKVETTAIYLDFAGEDERRFAEKVWKIDYWTKLNLALRGLISHIGDS